MKNFIFICFVLTVNLATADEVYFEEANTIKIRISGTSPDLSSLVIKPNIKRVSLAGTIQNIPNEFWELFPNIESFNLYCDNKSSLSFNLAPIAKQLKSLTFMRCNLTQVEAPPLENLMTIFFRDTDVNFHKFSLTYSKNLLSFHIDTYEPTLNISMPDNFFTTLINLRSLTVNFGSYMTKLPSSLGQLSKLKFLKMTSLAEELNTDIFLEMNNLFSIKAIFPNLKKIGANTFSPLKEVQIIDMDFLEDVAISKDAFLGIHNVQTISLEMLKVRHIETGTFKDISNTVLVANMTVAGDAKQVRDTLLQEFSAEQLRMPGLQ